MVKPSNAFDFIFILTAILGILAVFPSILAFLYIQQDLANLSELVAETVQTTTNESNKLWKELKEFNIKDDVLRQRRQIIQSFLGRPLTTSASIGFSNGANLGGTPKKMHGTKIYGKSNRKYRTTVLPTTSSTTTAYQRPYSSSYAEYNSYGSSTSDGYYSPPAFQPFSDHETLTPNRESQEIDIEISSGKSPICKCSSENKCPAGPPGPPGLAGNNGVPGNDGDHGVKGQDMDDMMLENPPLNYCVTCPQGEAGVPGRDGKRGARGLRGIGGIAGIYGRPGSPGLPGVHGPEGVPGEDGELGPMGVKGSHGIAGKGLPGNKGATGPQGLIGEPGFNGQDGLLGPTGKPGRRGDLGTKGKRGDDGEKGDIGMDGEPGIDAEYCPCPRKQLRREYNPVNRLLRH